AGAATRTAAGFATTGLTYLPTVCGMTLTASIPDGDGKERSTTPPSQTGERQSWNACLEGPRCAVDGPAVAPRLSRGGAILGANEFPVFTAATNVAAARSARSNNVLVQRV